MGRFHSSVKCNHLVVHAVQASATSNEFGPICTIRSYAVTTYIYMVYKVVQLKRTPTPHLASHSPHYTPGSWPRAPTSIHACHHHLRASYATSVINMPGCCGSSSCQGAAGAFGSFVPTSACHPTLYARCHNKRAFKPLGVDELLLPLVTFLPPLLLSWWKHLQAARGEVKPQTLNPKPQAPARRSQPLPSSPCHGPGLPASTQHTLHYCTTTSTDTSGLRLRPTFYTYSNCTALQTERTKAAQ